MQKLAKTLCVTLMVLSAIGLTLISCFKIGYYVSERDHISSTQKGKN